MAAAGSHEAAGTTRTTSTSLPCCASAAAAAASAATVRHVRQRGEAAHCAAHGRDGTREESSAAMTAAMNGGVAPCVAAAAAAAAAASAAGGGGWQRRQSLAAAPPTDPPTRPNRAQPPRSLRRHLTLPRGHARETPQPPLASAPPSATPWLGVRPPPTRRAVRASRPCPAAPLTPSAYHHRTRPLPPGVTPPASRAARANDSRARQNEPGPPSHPLRRRRRFRR